MNRGILVSRKRLSEEEQDFLKGGERFVENSNEN